MNPEAPETPPLTAFRPLQWWYDRSVRTKVLGVVLIGALVAIAVGVLGVRAVSSTASRSIPRIVARALPASCFRT